MPTDFQLAKSCQYRLISDILAIYQPIYPIFYSLKACLVAKGFKQKKCVDYFDTFALVTKISLIRVLITLASVHNLVIHQIDVKTAFLNGELEKEI